MSNNFQVLSAKALEVHNLDRRFHPWHDSFEQVSTVLASIEEMLLFSSALMMQCKYLWKWSSPVISYLFRIINLPTLNLCVHVYFVCGLFAMLFSPDHSTCSDSQNSSLPILITQRLRDFLSQWASCPHNENLHTTHNPKVLLTTPISV